MQSLWNFYTYYNFYFQFTSHRLDTVCFLVFNTKMKAMLECAPLRTIDWVTKTSFSRKVLPCLKANLDFSNARDLNLATEKDTALPSLSSTTIFNYTEIKRKVSWVPNKDIRMIWGLKMRLYNHCKTYL